MICYPDTTDWSCYGDDDVVSDLDPNLRMLSEQFAWAALARLTGFRLSLCPVTVRPCAARCNPSAWIEAPVGLSGSGAFQPFISGGRWFNSCGCSRPGSCSCTVIQEIALPGEVSGPITVRIDGAMLEASAYRVDNGNRLVRQDGEAWPICQDMNLPDGEVGTFSISYYPGLGPDALLSSAAGILAAEYYKSCQGKDCRLPSNVIGVTRQGVQFQIAADSFGSGLSGIREVDDIVGIYNPFRLKVPPRVMSPDRRGARMRTA